MAAVPMLARPRTGLVRVRQIVDQLRHGLSFVPATYVVLAIAVVHAALWFDRRLGDDVPDVVRTTVGGARSVFGVLAGGLITAITLLLSMTLITVQLASSQLSPRTVRDWLGDRVLQHTVGLALGSTVFALLALRSTRTLGEDDVPVVPHTTVIAAVVLGVASLFMLVRSVDHIADSVRVGSVARRIADRTRRTIEDEGRLPAGQAPTGVPAARAALDGELEIPAAAGPIESPGGGWVQQIDVEAILEALPDATRALVAVPSGGFVPHGSPLVWLSPEPPEDDPCRERLLGAFALGDTRTLQQDVAFGIAQLTDIAVRALSPGVNDPGTADEIIARLGDLLLRVWERPVAAAEIVDGTRTVVVRRPSHGELLRRACDPIRRHGRADPGVSTSLVTTLAGLRVEALRRDLPGPIEPIDAMIVTIRETASTDGWSDAERRRFDDAVGARLGPDRAG